MKRILNNLRPNTKQQLENTNNCTNNQEANEEGKKHTHTREWKYLLKSVSSLLNVSAELKTLVQQADRSLVLNACHLHCHFHYFHPNGWRLCVLCVCAAQVFCFIVNSKNGMNHFNWLPKINECSENWKVYAENHQRCQYFSYEKWTDAEKNECWGGKEKGKQTKNETSKNNRHLHFLGYT